MSALGRSLSLHPLLLLLLLLLLIRLLLLPLRLCVRSTSAVVAAPWHSPPPYGLLRETVTSRSSCFSLCFYSPYSLLLTHTHTNTQTHTKSRRKRKRNERRDKSQYEEDMGGRRGGRWWWWRWMMDVMESDSSSPHPWPPVFFLQVVFVYSCLSLFFFFSFSLSRKKENKKKEETKRGAAIGSPCLVDWRIDTHTPNSNAKDIEERGRTGSCQLFINDNDDDDIVHCLLDWLAACVSGVREKKREVTAPPPPPPPPPKLPSLHDTLNYHTAAHTHTQSRDMEYFSFETKNKKQNK